MPTKQTPSQSLGARILAKSEMTASGCRVWKGWKDPDGYGVIRLDERTKLRAHRAAYEAAHGPIPPGLIVMHMCDVRACVNPEHLHLGTHADNQADKVRKGRQARGERNGSAKLSAPDVIRIRSDTRRPPDIARAFGISADQVRLIQKRVKWAHV